MGSSNGAHSLNSRDPPLFPFSLLARLEGMWTEVFDMAGPTIIMPLRSALFLSSTEARCAFSRDLRVNSGTVLSYRCVSPLESDADV